MHRLASTCLLLIGLLPVTSPAQDPPLYRIEPFTLVNVKAHVERGVDVKKPDGPGWRWMYRAAYDANTGIMRFLLEQGVPADAKVFDPWTPLFSLSYMSHVNLPWRDNLGCAQLLVEHGADVNYVERVEGNTPLLVLANGGDPKLARFLLEHGADPNLKNKHGESALARSIESPRSTYELTRALLEGGAWATMPHTFRIMNHSTDVTPLHMAAYKGDLPVVSLMVKLSADLNVQNEGGRTPLHVAALLDRNEEIVRLLLKSGASTTIKDELDETAEDVARRKNNQKVLNVFRSNRAGH